MQSKQDPDQASIWLSACPPNSSPLPTKGLGFSSATPSPWWEERRLQKRAIGWGETGECPDILAAWGGAERTSQNRSRERGWCSLKFAGVGAVVDAVSQWVSNVVPHAGRGSIAWEFVRGASPTPDLLNQKPWGWRPENCFKKPCRWF